MKLPQVNPHEELEDISNNKFRPLFDVHAFEIRPEAGRDKGIDFRVELKKTGVYTGFRFLVQLKATESIKRNADKSISISIHTSNINYLLNTGIPAYYCLYFAPDNVFLYESLNEFVKRISENDGAWGLQESHTLRLSKELNQEALQEIYKTAHDRGLFLRKLNQQLSESSSLVSERILIDHTLEAVTDSEIRKLIEGVGLKFINESRSVDIIKIHERGSQQIASTARYNMVIGIAYYYTGELIKSLNFIKSALMLHKELTTELVEHLQLFDITVRFALGLMTKEEHDSRLSNLETSSHLRYYVLVHKVKELYLRSSEPDVDKRYDEFFEAMERILKAPDANGNVKLMVQCELILYEGSKINMDFARRIANVKAYESIFGFSNKLRADMLNEILRRKSLWASEANELRKYALSVENVFAFYHVLLNEAKVNYEFEVYADLVNFEEQARSTPHTSERLEVLNQILTTLEHASKYFQGISHVDNLCVVLSLQYEVLHYKNDLPSAEKIKNQLSDLIDTYEFKELKTKLNLLMNGGTTHEKLARFYNDVTDQSRNRQKEYEELVKEMMVLDEMDQKRRNVVKDPDVIELYPIGHFWFPKEFREEVFHLLNVSEDAKETFLHMLNEGRAVPIANVYCDPILEEGYGEVASCNDIVVWRRIHRIRKEFFARGFYRLEIA